MPIALVPARPSCWGLLLVLATLARPGLAAEAPATGTLRLAPDTPAPTAAPGPRDVHALALHEALARIVLEVQRLAAQVGGLPPELELQVADAHDAHATTQDLDLILADERATLRARIARLETRITLLESIQQHQEAADRVRLMTLQNALEDLDTDEAALAVQERAQRTHLEEASRALAARIALQERIDEQMHAALVHIHELSRLGAAAAPTAAPTTSAVAPAATGSTSAGATTPAR